MDTLKSKKNNHLELELIYSSYGNEEYHDMVSMPYHSVDEANEFVLDIARSIFSITHYNSITYNIYDYCYNHILTRTIYVEDIDYSEQTISSDGLVFKAYTNSKYCVLLHDADGDGICTYTNSLNSALYIVDIFNSINNINSNSINNIIDMSKNRSILI